MVSEMRTIIPKVDYHSMDLRIQSVDNHYVILGPKRTYRIMLLISPFIYVGAIVGGIFIPNYLFSIGFAIGGLIHLLRTFTTKIVIDKFSQSIMLDNQRCLLFHHRRELSFLLLRSVDIGEEEKSAGRGGGTYIEYSVILKFEDENIQVSGSRHYEKTRQMAETIGNFVKKPLVHQNKSNC